MKTAVLAAAASAAWLATSLCARAGTADPFAKWLNQQSPTCVPVADFAAVARPIELTPEQFEFVRALYVAMPPMSKDLPPGDHAVMATAGDETLLALVGGDMSCARFLAPRFIVAMLMEVGQGATYKVGEPASYEIER